MATSLQQKQQQQKREILETAVKRDKYQRENYANNDKYSSLKSRL